MARIQLISAGPSEGAPYPGALVSADAVGAAARGGAAIGQAVGQVGELAGALAMKMAEAKNAEDRAKAQMVMRDEAAKIQTKLATDPNEETWEATAKQGVNNARSAVFTQKLAPVVRKELELQMAEWGQKTQISVQTQATARKIERATTAIMGEAEARVRAQDWDGAVAQVDEAASVGLLGPKERADEVKRILDYGGYYEAQQKLSSLADLSPRARTAELAKLNQQLLTRNEDGSFTYFEDPEHRGGMSARGRIEMSSVIASQQRAAVREMDGNAHELIVGLRTGNATLADVGTAFDSGQISGDGVEQFLRANKVFEGVLSEKQQVKARAQETRAKSLEQDALEKGTAGFRELDVAIQTGSITPARGREIKSRLDVAAQADRTTDSFSDIRDQLDSWYARKTILNKAGNNFFPSAQPDDAEFQKLLGDIDGAPLTMPAKLELLQGLFEAKMADISDLQEEGKGSWWDRDITEPERKLRTELLQTYKNLLPSLGLQTAGSLLFGQEDMIRGFFDGNKEPTPQDVEKFRKEVLLPQIQESASNELLRAQFDF